MADVLFDDGDAEDMSDYIEFQEASYGALDVPVKLIRYYQALDNSIRQTAPDGVEVVVLTDEFVRALATDLRDLASMMMQAMEEEQRGPQVVVSRN